MIADVFTKALTAKEFAYQVYRLGIRKQLSDGSADSSAPASAMNTADNSNKATDSCPVGTTTDKAVESPCSDCPTGEEKKRGTDTRPARILRGSRAVADGTAVSSAHGDGSAGSSP